MNLLGASWKTNALATLHSRYTSVLNQCHNMNIFPRLHTYVYKQMKCSGQLEFFLVDFFLQNLTFQSIRIFENTATRAWGHLDLWLEGIGSYHYLILRLISPKSCHPIHMYTGGIRSQNQGDQIGRIFAKLDDRLLSVVFCKLQK
jgi:hypothetical protein